MFVCMRNNSNKEVLVNTQYIISIKECDEKLLMVMSGVDGTVEILMDENLEVIKEMLNVLSFDKCIGRKNIKLDKEENENDPLCPSGIPPC